MCFLAVRASFLEVPELDGAAGAAFLAGGAPPGPFKNACMISKGLDIPLDIPLQIRSGHMCCRYLQI
jgi:hypothetical protein